MYCKICGASLTPGEVFCKNCGASNTNEQVQPTVPNIEPNLNQKVNPNMPPRPVPPVNQGLVPPNVNPMPMPEENLIPPGKPVSHEPVPPVEEISEEKPEDEKKANGKFLYIIGVIVGILALAVISYLIYSSLQAKEKNNDGPTVTMIENSNYKVVYGGYSFNLSSGVDVSVGSSLEVRRIDWNAKISYAESPNFNKLTEDNIQKAFESTTGYQVSEFISKNYSGLSCFSSNVDYDDGTKTVLLLCDRENGYWYAEIGTSTYTSYPTSDLVNEMLKLITTATKDTNENKFKIENVEINVSDELSENTESSQQ